MFNFGQVLTFSNFLSLLRGPLALVFIVDNPIYRTISILLAMGTDSLDGYLARRYRKTSQVGAFIDAFMDKFFVFFTIYILLLEGRLHFWEFLTLFSRDFAILFYGFYLATLKSQWRLQLRSIWTGKITTTLQFFVLLGLIYHYTIPFYVFWCFIFLGISAFFELCWTERVFTKPS